MRLRLPSSKCLGIVLDALKPEVEKPPTTRSHAFLEKDNGMLVLRVEAGDTVALRAALNAYLRWINSVVEVLEGLENL